MRGTYLLKGLCGGLASNSFLRLRLQGHWDIKKRFYLFDILVPFLLFLLDLLFLLFLLLQHFGSSIVNDLNIAVVPCRFRRRCRRDSLPLSTLTIGKVRQLFEVFPQSFLSLKVFLGNILNTRTKVVDWGQAIDFKSIEVVRRCFRMTFPYKVEKIFT